MRIKDEFSADDLELARRHVRRHPFATIVTSGLQATHMPCLVVDDAGRLVIDGHVAKADPVAEQLDGPLLLIFAGPAGYVSASWYRTRELIPTWNHVTLHVWGRPALIDAPLDLLRRTVDHFEAPVERPWSLDEQEDGGRGMAQEVIGFRLAAERWHLEEKLSQDKPEELQADVVAGLEADGPYRDDVLAAAMRRLGGADA